MEECSRVGRMALNGGLRRVWEREYLRGGNWAVIGCECIGLLAARPVGKEKSFLSFNVPPGTKC